MNGKINNISFYIGIIDHQNNHIRISELQSISMLECQNIGMTGWGRGGESGSGDAFGILFRVQCKYYLPSRILVCGEGGGKN